MAQNTLTNALKAINQGLTQDSSPSLSSIGDLTVELHNASGEKTKKQSISDLANIFGSETIPENLSYGIEIDTASSSPSVTRIGNMSYHASLPVQSQMRGCLLNDNGQVNEYLPANSWTSATRDGSAGQVMVEIPRHWQKFETVGTNKLRVWLSLFPLGGFTEFKKQYVSAYQATIDRTNNKLASVRNTTAQYRGGNNTDSWDFTNKTLLGMPATNKSLTDFRTYARNRKSGSTEWNIMTYDLQKTIYWLFVVEYATLNTQAPYNAALDSNNCHQGGLGVGVTNLDNTKWNTFNGYNPFVSCGITDQLGNGTGQLAADMPPEYDSTTLVYYVPRYRGIENPFGHIWQWTDGILVSVESGSGASKVYTCSDPSKFSSSSTTNYTYIGDEARTQDFVKTILFGSRGDIIATAVGNGADASKYYCDNHYTNLTVSSSPELRGVHFGGSAPGGAYAGFVSSASHHVPSYSHAIIGSRLCFIPR